MIKSIVIQKLNQTTYEYVVETLHKFDFSLGELMDTLRFLIDRWEYEQIISWEVRMRKSKPPIRTQMSVQNQNEATKHRVSTISSVNFASLNIEP